MIPPKHRRLRSEQALVTPEFLRILADQGDHLAAIGQAGDQDSHALPTIHSRFHHHYRTPPGFPYLELSPPDLPIVVTTGYSERLPDEEPGRLVVLRKPYSVFTLVRAITGLLFCRMEPAP